MRINPLRPVWWRLPVMPALEASLGYIGDPVPKSKPKQSRKALVSGCQVRGAGLRIWSSPPLREVMRRRPGSQAISDKPAHPTDLTNASPRTRGRGHLHRWALEWPGGRGPRPPMAPRPAPLLALPAGPQGTSRRRGPQPRTPSPAPARRQPGPRPAGSARSARPPGRSSSAASQWE
jgi:hypothetical protein